MHPLDRLLLENKAWIQERLEDNPDFLKHLAENRTPDIFWIGCSDSRLHADEITNSEPGEILVHRNIGNQVVSTDFNLLGALEYAVNVLNVKHIIVCGHYRCRSVKAALDRPNPNLPFADKWLRNIKDVYRLHKAEVDAQPDEQARLDRLVELNVQEQVLDLAKTSIIQKAWKDRGGPHLHGWVYRLSDGIVKTVFEMEAGTEIDPIYRFDNLD